MHNEARALGSDLVLEVEFSLASSEKGLRKVYTKTRYYSSSNDEEARGHSRKKKFLNRHGICFYLALLASRIVNHLVYVISTYQPIRLK